MSETYNDPYANMKFDPSPFDKEIGKVKDSFDATISEAGMQAGMASGQGFNPGRVTADVYSRIASNRDATVGNLEGQKATAQAQFDADKQAKQAEARRQWELTRPGFLDYAGMALDVIGTGITGYGAIKSILNLGKRFKGINKANASGNMSYKPPSPTVTPTGKVTESLPPTTVTEPITEPVAFGSGNMFKPLAQFDMFRRKTYPKTNLTVPKLTF